MGRIYLTAVLFTLLSVSCGREFQAPPPAATISDFSPDHGFMDVAVGICGNNFDPQPASNLVYFGTQAVEVLPDGQPEDAQPAPDFECNDSLLWVRVPELAEEGGVDLKISTRYGQAVSPRPFVYDGPGHPVAGTLRKKINIRAGLWSVITPAESDAGTFVTIGLESNVLGVFEDHYGLHLDFVLCDTPLSAATAVTDSLEYTVFFSHLRFIPPPDFGVEVSLTRWRVNLLDLAAGTIEAPLPVDPPSTSQGPFVPNQIWTFPRPDQQHLWVEHDVVMTHLNRGALAIVATDEAASFEIVELPDQPLHCDPNRLASQVPIVDLVYDTQAQDFYVALNGTNEIWRIPGDTRQPRRVWPPEADSAGYVDCSWWLSSLALRRSQLAHANLRLYAAEARTLRVIEMKLEDLGPDESLVPTLNVATFDSRPYDLITGLFPTTAESGADIAGEHLYVATQNGLSIVDISDTTPLTPSIEFETVGELAVPMNRGSAQSLARRTSFNLLNQRADTILFTDANSDQVLKITCGKESIPQGDTATGSSFAQLATSHKTHRIFLSDALSNTVHVIDRNSGLREGQFPITSLDRHPTMGFGSIGLTTLREPDHDLLILPLTDLAGQDNIMKPAQFRPIAFGRIGDDLPACGLTAGGLEVDDSLSEKFDQLDLVQWRLEEGRSVPLMVLTRYFEMLQPDGNGDPQPLPGRIWCLEINPDPAAGESLVGDPVGVCEQALLGQLGQEVQMVRPDPVSPLLVGLETVRTPEGRQAIGVRLWDLSAGAAVGTSILHQVEVNLAGDITDLAMVPRGPDGRLYQTFLALPRLGYVLLVTFDLDAETSSMKAIPAGGDPSLLSVSPDGSRLYVTHFFGGQVSVIQTDCQPIGQCERVESTIDVDAWPGPVTFSDSGRAAYVVHYVSGDISWIE